MKKSLPASKAPPLRLLAPGTRVVILGGSAGRAGAVEEVRNVPHLKTYVVACDDGSTVFASAYDLAREDDPMRAPVGPRPEY